MKRMWFGIGLLAVMLLGCLQISRSANRICLPAADTAAQASEACIAEDTQAAKQLLLQSAHRWQQYRQQIAVWTDHKSIEKADLLFAQAWVCLHADELGEAASVCARLSRLLQAIADIQQLSWQNLL